MSSEIGKWIRHTFGLLFLDPHEVSACFVNDFMSDCPDDERLKKYCDYFTDNSINEESLFSLMSVVKGGFWVFKNPPKLNKTIVLFNTYK